MRITVELPDDLLRRIKVRAVLTDRRLKQLMPVLLELGLDADERGQKPPTRPRREPSAKRRVVGARPHLRSH